MHLSPKYQVGIFIIIWVIYYLLKTGTCAGKYVLQEYQVYGLRFKCTCTCRMANPGRKCGCVVCVSLTEACRCCRISLQKQSMHVYIGSVLFMYCTHGTCCTSKRTDVQHLNWKSWPCTWLRSSSNWRYLLMHTAYCHLTDEEKLCY